VTPATPTSSRDAGARQPRDTHSDKTVLIIAPSDDPHACVVARRLETLNAKAIILDSAQFPSQWSLSVALSDETSLRFVLGNDEIEIDETDVSGVWWRRPKRYVPSSAVEDPNLRRFVACESQAAFEGWLHCLGDRVINPLASDRAASHKLFQLQCAVQSGLRIPRSLATNSPQQARRFTEVDGSAYIYKPFTAADWQLIPTQRLSSEAVRHLETVAYAPVIFQDEIQKTADIRVTILDDQIFSVLIQSRNANAPLDWRIDPGREYVPHELPEQVRASLIALMGRLELRYAACDLALTERGEYVFFEANTGGQWLFAEIMADQPISWAFANALLGDNGKQQGEFASDDVKNE
jgi:hypothetical protein